MVFFSLQTIVIGQTVLFAEGTGINKARYEGVEGNPYYFKEFIGIKILDEKGVGMKQDYANFNAHTGNIEVKNGEKLIELDERFVDQVVFYENDKEIVFISGKKIGRSIPFVCGYFIGKEYVLYEEISAGISQKTIQSVGRTIKIERFQHRDDLYICMKGNCEEIKLKKKDILNYLRSDEADKFIEEQNLKFKDISDLVLLLDHLESLLK